MKEPYFSSGLVSFKRMKGPLKLLKGLEDQSFKWEDTGGQNADKYLMFNHTWKTQAMLQMLSHSQHIHEDKKTQQDLKVLVQQGVPCCSCSLLAQLQLVSSHVVLLSQLRCWTSRQKMRGAIMRTGRASCLQNNSNTNLTIPKGQELTSITDIYHHLKHFKMFFQMQTCTILKKNLENLILISPNSIYLVQLFSTSWLQL